jgi:hypothetical protein
MMQTVGFNRFIKREWLEFTAFLACREKDEKIIRKNLNEYLEKETKAEITRQKTVAELLRIWVNVPASHENLKEKALDLFEKVPEDEKMLLHWSMIILAFPIFIDVASSLGKIFSLQDRVSLKSLEKRIFEKWGERSTVKYALPKIVGSMVEWGVITRTKVGEYTKVQTIEIKNKDCKLFFINCYMQALEKDYLRFIEANNLSAAFPFKLNLGLDDFNNSNTLTLSRMGSDVVIIAR